ncbi:MAG: hypothetical protein JJE48_05600 [Actinobacteria bacterium]|nr:hypothetical protein [Actinomycetota bacterium]
MNGQTGSETEVVVYRESIGYGIWLFLLLTLLFGIFIAVLVIDLVRPISRLYLIFPITCILLFALVYLNFRRLLFEVTESHVRFGFGLIKKEFLRSDITFCEPYELTFKNYLGYGIRFGRDGTVAYNTRNGKGVKMVVNGQKKPYVVSVDDPEHVCGLLQQATR